VGRTLVIVESPTKASKIASYLGPGYVVESSRGHVRDLPTSAAEVPAKYKQEKWARTGVDVDNQFQPLYVVAPDRKKTIADLKKRLAESDELLLATDEDREGEAIAWHLKEELKPKVPVKRMVFHEITPQAIQQAVAHPRALDTDLVDAQETRRIVDRLYGYEVSPVLWKKVMPRLSAGRVQSVATRLVVDREKERMAFRSAEFWDVAATFDAGETADPPRFGARLTRVGGYRVAQGRDFSAQGVLTQGKGGKVLALDADLAERLAGVLRSAACRVAGVESRPYTRRPYAPFRTTTLQQEAGRKLGFTAQRTMMVAQDLYEAGWITYMRTDSVTLSTQAVQAARTHIAATYGQAYLPAKPRQYTSKVKNAQEAHEAIRPAGEVFRTPKGSGLTGDQLRLYELIWSRTLASQMADAEGEAVTVRIAATHEPVTALATPVTTSELTATGRTVTFPGFLRAYVESHDDPEDSDDDAQARLPRLAENQALAVDTVTAEGHETRPPARYTEPSLVAKLEELEIGRPSTYASILRTITARDYVFKKGQALVPTWLAFAVTRLLEEQFPQLVDYTFTATMEEYLDEIAKGALKRLDVLNGFYFGGSTNAGLRDLVGTLGDIDPRAVATFPIPGDAGLALRVGKYGPYIESPDGAKVTISDELPPDELTEPRALELLGAAGVTERVLGVAADTGLTVVAKDGRYGPYVTEVLPEGAPKSAKPRTGSLFKSMTLDTVTLAQAEQLLSLPRTLGTLGGETVTAQNGRYGPYIRKGTTSRPLPGEEALFTVTLQEAEALFAAAPVRGGRAGTAPARELGTDPATGGTVTLKSGRFGPYVTDGVTNATLRRSDSPEELTPERAYELLAEKRAKPPAARTPSRRRA